MCPPEPSLVIFDCDGVLVDTEPTSARVMAEFVAELGWALSTSEADRLFRGRSLSDCQAIIANHAPVPDDFVPELERRTITAFARGIQAMPGAQECLDRLDEAGISYCVASSGSHDKMRSSLGSANLWERVRGRLFSANEVRRGKPAPDIFLYATERMGDHHVDRTVVIEDSEAGVRAAVAAGLRVFGLSPEPHPALEQAGALPLRHLGELPARLGLSTVR